MRIFIKANEYRDAKLEHKVLRLLCNSRSKPLALAVRSPNIMILAAIASVTTCTRGARVRFIWHRLARCT